MTAAFAATVSEDAAESQAVVSFWLDDQQLALPLRHVQEVLSARPVTPIPLAPGAVAGSFNLRGRIVTVVDMRRRLGMPPRASGTEGVVVVVERDQEVFGLRLDSAGDVLVLGAEHRACGHPLLDPRLGECARAFHHHAGQSLVLLDIDRLLNLGRPVQGMKAEQTNEIGVPL